MKMRRIIAVPSHAEAVRSEFKRFLDEASLENWVELKVRFGFAWNARPDRGDGAEIIMSPAILAETVAAAESQKEGRIGSDDLFVTPAALGVEHLFCHDADIHLEGPESSEYLESAACRFASLGWAVYDTRKAPGETAYARTSRFTTRR
jgi:hypothetical protein